jgi:hypothetical protein
MGSASNFAIDLLLHFQLRTSCSRVPVADSLRPLVNPSSMRWTRAAIVE